MKMKTGIVAAVASCAVAGVVQGTDELHFDINKMTVQARTSLGGSAQAFDPSGSGVLEFSFTVGSALLIDERLDIHGSDTYQLHGVFTGSTTEKFTNITGHLFYSAGAAGTGEFEITLDGDTYSADIASGATIGSTSAGYVLQGDTFAGLFSSTFFGPIDVSKYDAGEPLQGRFWQFEFKPDASGLADDSHFEAFVLVPLPPAAYAGVGMLAGVMGLSYVLRRR